mmetsp:Transcript_52163/g.153945  ORF Transcript_52163/g.153945 Transcript_52163/m.153945 type:complete len:230 (-) Transcript_52163:106-795(-)
MGREAQAREENYEATMVRRGCEGFAPGWASGGHRGGQRANPVGDGCFGADAGSCTGLCRRAAPHRRQWYSHCRRKIGVVLSRGAPAPYIQWLCTLGVSGRTRVPPKLSGLPDVAPPDKWGRGPPRIGAAMHAVDLARQGRLAARRRPAAPWRAGTDQNMLCRHSSRSCCTRRNVGSTSLSRPGFLSGWCCFARRRSIFMRSSRVSAAATRRAAARAETSCGSLRKAWKM